MRRFIVPVFLFAITFLFPFSSLAREKINFKLPEKAKLIFDDVYDLGEALDNGVKVRGLAIMHPKKFFAKKQLQSHTNTSKCYTYIARGARWRTTEDYLLDPTNADAYPSDRVVNEVAAAMQTWENPITFNIFGNNIGTGVDGVDSSSPDNKNEIFFGDIAEPGVIAVTTVWYTIFAPRRIVEYDLMFDDPDIEWGDATTEPNKMDFLNIAVHEIGHGGGMGDLYKSYCSEQTMYGYATEGETKKRDLDVGDINGIKNLYK